MGLDKGSQKVLRKTIPPATVNWTLTFRLILSPGPNRASMQRLPTRLHVTLHVKEPLRSTSHTPNDIRFQQ